MILTVKILMTATTLCFLRGFRLARSDPQRHRRWMLAGLVSFVAIAVALVLGVHVFEQSYSPAPWTVGAFGEPGARFLLKLHRGMATVSAILLLMQAVSGWKRRPAHLKLGPATLACWLVSYASGLVLFA